MATWSLGVGIPTSGVILESGYLYGTALGEYGFVYKVKPGSTKLDGFFTFANGLLDGNDPRYGVIMDGGNLYGTTYYGGHNNLGVVYKLNPSLKEETVLHTF